jgi:hypothetical protein
MIKAMMKVASTSETSVNFYQTTWLNIPEDSLILAAVRTRKLNLGQSLCLCVAWSGLSHTSWAVMDENETKVE